MLLWTVIGVTIVVGLVFWFVLTLQCKPVSYFWNRLSPGAKGTCLDVDTIIGIAYLYSVTATLCDFVLGLLPISLVWKLQMTRKTKIALAAILSLGCMYALSPSRVLSAPRVFSNSCSEPVLPSSFASLTSTITKTTSSFVSRPGGCCHRALTSIDYTQTQQRTSVSGLTSRHLWV